MSRNLVVIHARSLQQPIAAAKFFGPPTHSIDPDHRLKAMMTSMIDEVRQPMTSLNPARVSKASFGGVFWGPESRRFAEEWDGTGLADELVDGAALRTAWRAPVPVYGSALPLQAAWLFDRTRRRAALPPAP